MDDAQIPARYRWFRSNPGAIAILLWKVKNGDNPVLGNVVAINMRQGRRWIDELFSNLILARCPAT